MRLFGVLVVDLKLVLLVQLLRDSECVTYTKEAYHFTASVCLVVGSALLMTFVLSFVFLGGCCKKLKRLCDDDDDAKNEKTATGPTNSDGDGGGHRKGRYEKAPSELGTIDEEENEKAKPHQSMASEVDSEMVSQRSHDVKHVAQTEDEEHATQGTETEGQKQHRFAVSNAFQNMSRTEVRTEDLFNEDNQSQQDETRKVKAPSWYTDTQEQNTHGFQKTQTPTYIDEQSQTDANTTQNRSKKSRKSNYKKGKSSKRKPNMEQTQYSRIAEPTKDGRSKARKGTSSKHR